MTDVSLPVAAGDPINTWTRVCRKCATQAQTSSEMCPACGSRYQRRSKRALALWLGLPLILLAAGAATAAILVIHHNNVVAARKHAAHVAAVKAAHVAAVNAAHARAAAAAERRAEAQAKRDEARMMRQATVSSLESSIKKDAQKDVNNGLLTGPILKVACQPATSVDATASIANYSCIAATSVSGTEYKGYTFSANVNINTGSYTWHLGG